MPTQEVDLSFRKVGQMRLTAIILLCVGGGVAAFAGQTQARAAVIDVALTETGSFISQCQTGDEQPVVGAVVMLLQNDQLVASTTTRADGWFKLPAVTPGAYVLKAKEWQHAIRIWDRQSAPPSGRSPIVLILSSPETVLQDARPPEEAQSDDVLAPEPPVEQPSTTTEPVDLAAEDVDIESPAKPPTHNEGMETATHREETEAGVPLVEKPQEHTDAIPAHANAQQVAFVQNEVPAEPDAVFDPFAQSPSPDTPSTTPMTAQREVPPPNGPPQPMNAPSGPAQVQPQPAQAQPVPAQVPPPMASGYGSTRVVGPTVGDVVVTSIGIAGITVGAIAIHEYNNRSERRIVSP